MMKCKSLIFVLLCSFLAAAVSKGQDIIYDGSFEVTTRVYAKLEIGASIEDLLQSEIPLLKRSSKKEKLQFSLDTSGDLVKRVELLETHGEYPSSYTPPNSFVFKESGSSTIFSPHDLPYDWESTGELSGDGATYYVDGSEWVVDHVVDSQYEAWYQSENSQYQSNGLESVLSFKTYDIQSYIESEEGIESNDLEYTESEDFFIANVDGVQLKQNKVSGIVEVVPLEEEELYKITVEPTYSESMDDEIIKKVVFESYSYTHSGKCITKTVVKDYVLLEVEVRQDDIIESFDSSIPYIQHTSDADLQGILTDLSGRVIFENVRMNKIRNISRGLYIFRPINDPSAQPRFINIK